MKRIFLLVGLTFLIFSIRTAPEIVEEGTKFRWGGTIRLDNFFDTRQVLATPDGAWSIWPKKIMCDSFGNDINAHGRFGMSAAYSTVYFKTESAINNVKLNSHVEFDFGSLVHPGVPKIRRAYFKAAWEDHSALVGYSVHPLIASLWPNTVGWHGGNPCAGFSANPQICFSYKPHKIRWKIAPYSQFNYTDDGPLGEPNMTYSQNSMSPAIYTSLEYEGDNFKVGIGVDMKRLLPALSTSSTSTTSSTTFTNANVKSLTSFLGAIFGEVNINDFHFKAEALLGQNGYDKIMIGGYALACPNPANGSAQFTNINFASGWFDFEFLRHKTLQPGFYLGYTKSLGTPKCKCVYLNANGNPIFYGFDPQIGAALRFAPRIRSKFKNVEIGFEADYTRAWYGRMNWKGQHPCTYGIGNLRVLLVPTYYF